MVGIAEAVGVAKKKGAASPKRYGTLIRVSDAFHAALTDAANFEKVSIAEYADAHLLPLVQKRYRDAVLKVAKRLESGEK